MVLWPFRFCLFCISQAGTQHLLPSIRKTLDNKRSAGVMALGSSLTSHWALDTWAPPPHPRVLPISPGKVLPLSWCWSSRGHIFRFLSSSFLKVSMLSTTRWRKGSRDFERTGGLPSYDGRGKERIKSCAGLRLRQECDSHGDLGEHPWGRGMHSTWGIVSLRDKWAHPVEMPTKSCIRHCSHSSEGLWPREGCGCCQKGGGKCSHLGKQPKETPTEWEVTP